MDWTHAEEGGTVDITGQKMSKMDLTGRRKSRRQRRVMDILRAQQDAKHRMRWRQMIHHSEEEA